MVYSEKLNLSSILNCRRQQLHSVSCVFIRNILCINKNVYVCVFICRQIDLYVCLCVCYHPAFLEPRWEHIVLCHALFKWLCIIPVCRYATNFSFGFLLNIQLFFQRPFANTNNAVSEHPRPDIHIFADMCHFICGIILRRGFSGSKGCNDQHGTNYTKLQGFLFNLVES